MRSMASRSDDTDAVAALEASHIEDSTLEPHEVKQCPIFTQFIRAGRSVADIEDTSDDWKIAERHLVTTSRLGG
jgi:hypothetical protein